MGNTNTQHSIDLTKIKTDAAGDLIEALLDHFVVKCPIEHDEEDHDDAYLIPFEGTIQCNLADCTYKLKEGKLELNLEMEK